MRRVVIDTNVYVDWINRGRHEEVLFERQTVKYLIQSVRSFRLAIVPAA